ncbi:hypothetical protein L2E82_22741 [Cichorium intybus]|uniref:Uncharacterized protein n=1 Tax=Cichorium intybus TaxID=13427 RepID=A0ACB9DYL2_CICIN|nr:hypothetical protein L2E82_22741 [Cichorium intybus]
MAMVSTLLLSLFSTNFSAASPPLFSGLRRSSKLDSVSPSTTQIFAIKVDMLENVEIGEQKRRHEDYYAAKKKLRVYADKFSDEIGNKNKILPQYDDPILKEVITLDE